MLQLENWSNAIAVQCPNRKCASFMSFAYNISHSHIAYTYAEHTNFNSIQPTTFTRWIFNWKLTGNGFSGKWPNYDGISSKTLSSFSLPPWPPLPDDELLIPFPNDFSKFAGSQQTNEKGEKRRKNCCASNRSTAFFVLFSVFSSTILVSPDRSTTTTVTTISIVKSKYSWNALISNSTN